MSIRNVSIIIPCYKAAATLRRAVASALTDAPSDIEILLVDDGSPDDTGALCDELAAADPRITPCTAKTAARAQPAIPGWTRQAANGCCFWMPTTRCCPGCGLRWTA